MVSVLDDFRKHTEVDLDANDAAAAIRFKPVGNMTSNQLIVFGELSKPEHRHFVDVGAKKALDIAKREGWTDEDRLNRLAADCMATELGATVLPHLEPGGLVLAQTWPSRANSTPDTVEHARLLVRLYELAGVPKYRVCIKVPSTLAGLRACKILRTQHNINTLGTVLFSVAQALAAAEEAGCILISPYLNPLYAHFDFADGKHTPKEDPLSEMPGLKISGQIQREYKRRKVQTKVMGASIITLKEAVSLTGMDRATLPDRILGLMAETPLDDTLVSIRDRALAMYDPKSDNDLELKGKKFPLEEPASELKAALASEDTAALIADALERFTQGERTLLGMAAAALLKVEKEST